MGAARMAAVPEAKQKTRKAKTAGGAAPAAADIAAPDQQRASKHDKQPVQCEPHKHLDAAAVPPTSEGAAEEAPAAHKKRRRFAPCRSVRTNHHNSRL